MQVKKLQHGVTSLKVFNHVVTWSYVIDLHENSTRPMSTKLDRIVAFDKRKPVWCRHFLDAYDHQLSQGRGFWWGAYPQSDRAEVCGEELIHKVKWLFVRWAHVTNKKRYSSTPARSMDQILQSCGP